MVHMGEGVGVHRGFGVMVKKRIHQKGFSRGFNFKIGVTEPGKGRHGNSFLGFQDFLHIDKGSPGSQISFPLKGEKSGEPWDSRAGFEVRTDGKRKEDGIN
jgi:hypothetical protein